MIQMDTLTELMIASVGGIAAVGLTILKLAMRSLEKQHEITQQLIEQKFQWAESRREEASSHWEQHFGELKASERQISVRLRSLEDRVITIELHQRPAPLSLTKNGQHSHTD